MKYRVAKEVLKEDINDSLLCICGGLFDYPRIFRCHIALDTAIKSLEKLDKVEQILQCRDDGYYEEGTYKEGNHWQILDEIEEVMHEDRDSNRNGG